MFKIGKKMTLEIREKMSVSGGQSYKKVIQLVLRTKKLIGERMSWGKFQKRKRFRFMSGQSSKKSRSFKSFDNSFGSKTNSVSSLQTFKSPQPSKLGMSPPNFTFRGRMMSERCPSIINFIRGFAICHKEYVFDVDRLGMLRNATHCWAILGLLVSHQRNLVL